MLKIFNFKPYNENAQNLDLRQLFKSGCLIYIFTANIIAFFFICKY